MPNSPSQWLVHVHSGHIVKGAKVVPEMSGARLWTTEPPGLRERWLGVI